MSESRYQPEVSSVNPVLQLENVARLYSMGDETIYALRDVSLSIHQNEYVAFMGPSGSGKSTLMNIIGCLDTPTSGSYLFEGEQVSSMNDGELAEIRNRKIGFVFQTFNLLPRITALQNVELPLVYSGISRGERYKRAEEVLTSVGLADRMEHRPNELSGGQRQRVAIARALVTRPSIILADEPTGNLDSAHGDEVMNMLTKLNESGTTIVMVTHSPTYAEYGNRIIHLFDGHVVTENMKNEFHV